VVERAVAAVGTARAAGTDWSMLDEFEVHTVGARIPLAYIVLGAGMGTRSRASSTVLISLVALDIERRNLPGQAERQRRSQFSPSCCGRESGPSVSGNSPPASA
jgi:purine catabolism regulator